ncbi:MAG TPA: SWIM zinc finger family protein [Dehalococcoidia bacterium]|nr:SWIM zinc finger family protein [Dehalococcoidia bacterium]
MGYRGYWGYYEPSRPLPVKDGIKTRSRRGKIGETWWSEKWVAFLESLEMGARLGRGRAYARRGQVMDVAIGPGLVTARVQGSRPQPYKVTIQLTPLSPEEWEKVMDAMASEALFAARLLAGEMPQNIEEAFRAAKVSLFPTRRKDLKSDCSCPDWANPCKHIAAVYLLLAEEFARDPFMIFRLRGKDKEELMDVLRERRAAGFAAVATADQNEAAEQIAEDLPLEACLGRFWAMGPEMASFRLKIAPPEVPLAVLKRLGRPPFWKEKGDIMDILGKAYMIASQAALKLAYNEGEGDGGP